MPAGKSRVAFLSVEQWGNSSFTAERFSPARRGSVSLAHPCAGTCSSPWHRFCPVRVGMLEAAVLAFPPLLQDFQAHELCFFLAVAEAGTSVGSLKCICRGQGWERVKQTHFMGRESEVFPAPQVLAASPTCKGALGRWMCRCS